MSETVSIAVVIAARNAARRLSTALESVANQTVGAEEIIVVDDGSTDETAAIAERHGATVLRQQQAGPGAARNRGIAAARSEFIAFLDADDWYAPSKLERSIGVLSELGAMALATDAWLVVGDRVDSRRNQSHDVPSVLTKELLIGDNPIVCSTVCCRRQAVLDAGAFAEDAELGASEDYDLWLRMTHREPIAYVAEPLTFYRVNSRDLSDNANFLDGIDRILARVSAVHVGESHFQRLVAKRRASVRIDVARGLLRRGKRREAIELLRAAAKLSPSWAGYKLWLRARLSSAGGAT